jgi:hypothetical protein
VSFSTDEDTADHEAPSGLLDRILRRDMIVLSGLFFIVFLASALISIGGEPWELDAQSPVVESIDSECGPFTGAEYTIRVEGRRYSCGGSDAKCPDGPVAVAYDPADPSRCRVAVNVDRLSLFEKTLMMSFCSATLFLIAGASYQRSEALRRADLLDGAATRQRQRARLRTLSAVILIASMVVGSLLVILALLSTPQ